MKPTLQCKTPFNYAPTTSTLKIKTPPLAPHPTPPQMEPPQKVVGSGTTVEVYKISKWQFHLQEMYCETQNYQIYQTWKIFLCKCNTHVCRYAVKSTSTNNVNSFTNSLIMVLQLHTLQELKE